MNIRILFFILCFLCTTNSRAQEAPKPAVLKDLLGDLSELFELTKNITASCESAFFDTQVQEMVMEELTKISHGIAEVLIAKGLTLALKEDYPSVCHVLTQEHLDLFHEGDFEEKECEFENFMGKGCILWRREKTPRYTYHWPKYFIEVSQKGNDPHNAFAHNNALYRANRKIAHELDRFIDPKPYTMLAKVIGVSALLKSVTKLDMGNEVGKAKDAGEQTAVLTPFEKMRIRASQGANQPSYEVNIWPVGLSHTFAKNLTLCQKGGYGWPIPLVPNTCPVAMARDIWPLWDTGFSDYLKNPKSLKRIATGSNPGLCMASYLGGGSKDRDKKVYDVDTEDPKTTGTPLTTQKDDFTKNRIATLSEGKGLRSGIQSCSFPLLGDAEVLAAMISDSTQEETPACTPWGSLAPRNSTMNMNTDFAFANTALKFKMLAHEAFGIPRGKKERWSLAYPWEDSPTSFVKEAVEKVIGVFNELITQEGTAQKETWNVGFSLPNLRVGRSRMLIKPGDIRMVDSSFNTQDYGQAALNFAKEGIYLAGIGKLSYAAGKKAEELVNAHTDKRKLDQKNVLATYNEDQDRAEDETARVGEEAIYRPQTFCHRNHNGALLTREDIVIEGQSFEVGKDKDSCFSLATYPPCLDWKGYLRGCRKPGRGHAVFIHGLTITGYRSVPNPKVSMIKTTCETETIHTMRSKKTLGPGIESWMHLKTCTQKQITRTQDTRVRDLRPQAEKPEEIFKESETQNLVAAAAKTATWVGGEIARAKWEEMRGKSLLPGKKRVYTVWEEISCSPPVSITEREFTDYPGVQNATRHGRWEMAGGGGDPRQACALAVRYEIRKFLQRRLLRKLCDFVFNEKEGAPFKKLE